MRLLSGETLIETAARQAVSKLKAVKKRKSSDPSKTPRKEPPNDPKRPPIRPPARRSTPIKEPPDSDESPTKKKPPAGDPPEKNLRSKRVARAKRFRAKLERRRGSSKAKKGEAILQDGEILARGAVNSSVCNPRRPRSLLENRFSPG